jgi:hypothetical protein
MDRERKIGLLANLPRLLARERVMNGDVGGDPKTVYETYLAAGFSEPTARKARLRALERYVDEKIQAAKASGSRRSR